MNDGKYDIICCKHCFYLIICNELSCIEKGNKLLIITNTINIIISIFVWLINNKNRIKNINNNTKKLRIFFNYFLYNFII